MSLQADLDSLARLIAKIKPRKLEPATPAADLWADVNLYAQAVRFALAYEPSLTAAEEAVVAQAIALGRARATALAAGRTPWHGIVGRVMRGFVSRIDGSSQPYSLHIPANLDWKKPTRLDVVLDGSRNPRGLACVTFLQRFAGLTPLESMPTPPIDGEPDYIQMTPLARVENAYRWAGETDVFEAIEAACRNYPIDRDRIVLRGMSMGGTGTWHLGLKHPSRFVAIAPYCGYVDTHRFSDAPFDHFPRIGRLPAHQEAGLHMLDSVDYAANVGAVPVYAAIGARDPFVEAHTIMNEAVRREGNQLVNLVSPFTQHSIDPATHKRQLQFVAGHADRGLDRFPAEVRFVTWTLRYNRCHWVELLGLGRHLERAEVVARVGAGGVVDIARADNITALAVDPGVFGRRKPRLTVGGVEVRLKSTPRPGRLIIALKNGRWVQLNERAWSERRGKRPQLQGPIDDAFFSAFLCVRGTGRPWNRAIGEFADASLDRFADEWARYWRGDLPVKNDADVTPDDIQSKHLILFGDGGSNRWIARAIGSLPITWTKSKLVFGDRSYDAATHAPLMISPSPLTSRERYIVLNSGHTFRGKDSATINYLLYPRLGDWAILNVGPGAPLDATGKVREQVVRTGFFDEAWQLPTE